MKKTICTVLLLICSAMFLCVPVFAENSEEYSNALEDYSESVSQRLGEAIDEETKAELSENGFTGDYSKLSFKGFLEYIWESFAGQLLTPVNILARLTAIIILTSLARSASVAGGTIYTAFSAVSVLGCITVIYQAMYTSFSGVCTYLDRLTEFMLSYIPIYASVTAASGGFSSGGSYYASCLGICEIIAFVSGNVIMPFLSIFLALSFTAAINPDMKFSSAAESIKNAVNVILKALMTIFTGFIAVQSISGAAADNAASRALKFGASNFIPIIGDSVSEAYSTVYGSIGIIRSSVGTLGVIVTAVMLLKPLISMVCLKIIMDLSKLIADLMGESEAAELLKSTGFAMSAAISTILCFGMMFIIATSVIMLTAANSVS